jgi:hypothetical protein
LVKAFAVKNGAIAQRAPESYIRPFLVLPQVKHEFHLYALRAALGYCGKEQ